MLNQACPDLPHGARSRVLPHDTQQARVIRTPNRTAGYHIVEFQRWEGGPDTVVRLNARASFLKPAPLPSTNAAVGAGAAQHIPRDAVVDAKPVRTSLRRAVKAEKRGGSVDEDEAGDEQLAVARIGRIKGKAEVDEADGLEVGEEEEEDEEDRGGGDSGVGVAANSMSDVTAMPKEGEPLDDPRKPMCIPVGTRVVLVHRPPAGKPNSSKVKASALVGKTVRQRMALFPCLLAHVLLRHYSEVFLGCLIREGERDWGWGILNCSKSYKMGVSPADKGSRRAW